MFKLGLVINPLAGIGGRAAFKGSDGADVVAEARRRGGTSQAPERARAVLEAIAPQAEDIALLTWGAPMGAGVAQGAGFRAEVLGTPRDPEATTAEDTRQAAAALAAAGCDLIVFVGGDGTARDIHAAVGEAQPVLGIPAGVKMHSSVYAVSPAAAAEIVRRLIHGGLVALQRGEVRDIDEARFREGVVRTRFHGELAVPEEGHYLQHVKVGGTESEPLVLEELAADLVEQMEADVLYIIGPGSTTDAIMRHMGLAGTLLGIDVVRNHELVAADVGERELLELVAHGQPARVVVTVIGGQGHIIGRGNQQLSPEVLRRVGLEHLIVVATRAKLLALEGRPLQVDTGDPELDRAFPRQMPVLAGYRDTLLYPVAHLD